MSAIATVVFINLGLVLGLFFLLWLASLALRDASIVDPFWGTGFVVVAWSTFWLGRLTLDDARAVLLLVLTTIWGGRLSLYLLWRNFGKGEDYRYQEMRRHHGSRFPWVSLLTVFGLQGLLLWIISMPIQIGPFSPSQAEVGWLDLLGVGIWTVGVFFEAVGDWQLARFKSEPANRGKVMDRGLWAYTRHPNYFGDFCVWWGLYLVAAAGGAWWTVFGPLLMSFFLLKVSGVAMLERTITERRPDYVDYIKRTNAFFPGPKRNFSHK